MGFLMQTVFGQLDEGERSRFDEARVAIHRGYLSIAHDASNARERHGLSTATMKLLSSNSQRDHRRFIRDPSVSSYVDFNRDIVSEAKRSDGFSALGWDDLAGLDDALKQRQTETKFGFMPVDLVTRLLSDPKPAGADQLANVLLAFAVAGMRSALGRGDKTRFDRRTIASEMRENLLTVCSSATIDNFDALHGLIQRNPPTGQFHQIYLDCLSSDGTTETLRLAFEPRRQKLRQEAEAALEAQRQREAAAAKAKADADNVNATFYLTDAGYVDLTPTHSRGFFETSKLADAVRSLASVMARAKGFVYYGNDTGTIVGAVRKIETMDWRMVALCKSLLLRDRAGEFDDDHHRRGKTVNLKVQYVFLKALNADGRTELAFRSGTSFSDDLDHKIAAQVGREYMHLYTGNLSKQWTELQSLHGARRNTNPLQAAVADFVLAPPK